MTAIDTKETLKRNISYMNTQMNNRENQERQDKTTTKINKY